ncbi:PadR family transcriptional regulator [Cytobacillus suaedae]|nr:PadR family transcriptional regulator [Cytobacillus suaedae]
MTKLIVLGLLRNKEMHGYEIQTIIQESRMDRWSNVLSGSIYYALNKMENEQIIEVVKEERTGARIRKIYKITENGEQQYQQLLRENLKLQPHSLKSDFMLSLAMIQQLPKDEARSILEENLAQLNKLKAEWQLAKQAKADTSVYNPIMEYSFDNNLQVINADIELVTKTLEYLSKNI